MRPSGISVMVGICLIGASSIAVHAAQHGASPASETEQQLSRALLAMEEAELRERMLALLILSDSIRLRGRALLVAIGELHRVRRSLAAMDSTDPSKLRLENRLLKLETRRREVETTLDQEFQNYVTGVSELGNDLWPRLRRVGEQFPDLLRRRNLTRLERYLPVLQRHIEEFNRSSAVNASALIEWRRTLDDTFIERRNRLIQNQPKRVPAEEPVQPKGDDEA